MTKILEHHQRRVILSLGDPPDNPIGRLGPWAAMIVGRAGSTDSVSVLEPAPGGGDDPGRFVRVTDPELVRDWMLGESPVAWLRRACQAGHDLDWALALFEQHLLQRE